MPEPRPARCPNTDMHAALCPNTDMHAALCRCAKLCVFTGPKRAPTSALARTNPGVRTDPCLKPQQARGSRRAHQRLKTRTNPGVRTDPCLKPQPARAHAAWSTTGMSPHKRPMIVILRGPLSSLWVWRRTAAIARRKFLRPQSDSSAARCSSLGGSGILPVLASSRDTLAYVYVTVGSRKTHHCAVGLFAGKRVRILVRAML